MTSVAGQIRIDLLAEVAQFNAGMRTAGGELEKFQQKAAEVDRKLGSQKSIADFAKREQDAWVKSMRGGDGPLQNVHGFLGGLKTEPDWRSMNVIPWGMPLRNELARETAETVRTITAKGRVVAGGLREAMREIGGATANSYGMGGAFSTVGKFAMGHPIITGAALAGGYIAKVAHDRDIRAREVEHASLQLGQGAEDTSRIMAMGFDVPMMTKFQKSIADKSPEQQAAFSKLKLDPNKLEAMPLKQALTEVGEAFNKYVINPADRASVALHLFGKGGGEVIATLAKMEEHAKLTGAHEIIKPEDIARVEAYDHAMKGLLNSINDLSLKAGRGIGSESGVGTGLARGASAVLSHPLEALGRTLLWPTKLFSDAPTKWISPGIEREQEKWAKDDANTRTASLREFNEKKQQDQDARRKAKQRHADAASEAERELFNLDMDPEVRTAAKQRDKFSKDLVGSGLGSDGVRQRMSRYDVIIAEQKQRKEDAKRQKDAEDAWKKDQEEGQRLYESVRSPGDKYRDETAKDEDLFRRKAINEDTLASLRRRHLEDYYREAGAMEAKSLRDSLKTPAEHYAERSKWIHKMAADGLLSPAEEAKLNQNDQRDLKSKLGIKDPMGDYAKDISERYDAMKAGLITPEEYRRYKKDRTKTAADEMVEQKPKMQALGAMGVASREEHALLTNAMIGDPAKQDRQRVLAKLDDLRRSVENLRIPQPQLQSI